MKAIVQKRYGPPEQVLSLRDIKQPSIRDDEVLVRVRAASVHADVWHVVNGRPYFLRLLGAGLLRPKVKVPGIDIAGQVKAVGKGATRFHPGDEVFGEIIRGHQWKNGGAYAEYAAVAESKLELKPQNLSFEQAAAVPTSGILAFQGMHDEGHLESGQNVLINGAGGAVGSFAVQIAKGRGAKVTAVDSADKLAMLRSIGADQVVDYTTDDFTMGDERYDLIYDVPGNRSFDDLKRVLAAGGSYVLVGHDDFGRSGNRWIGGTIGRILKLQLFAPFGRRSNDGDTATTKTEHPLLVLKDLIEAGTITPVVDRTYQLHEVPEALRYLQSRQVQGKVVVTI